MERNLEQELKDLNILSVECCGIGTKDDVLACIDAIKDHISANPDSEKAAYIQEAVKKREARLKAASFK